MKAYMVVGPTKLHPRRLRSFESATDPGVVLIVISAARVTRRGREAGAGCHRQKYALSDPHSRARSRAHLALLIVDSILPRCRTIAALSRRSSTRRGVNRATLSKSKPANAWRNASRLRRMVSQLRPAWKPSRQIFS